MMYHLGVDEIVKYPFLSDAGQYLKDQGFSLEQFGTDPDLQEILNRAYSRIETATQGKIYNSEFTESSQPTEIFSFLLAVVLLKLARSRTLIKRFALAEARRAEKYLQADISNELVQKIISELFSVQLKKTHDYFEIPVSDYLRHSISFHEREWKLVNRRVENGMVCLSSHDAVRLIRTKLTLYIDTKINSSKTPEMFENFKVHVQNLENIAKKFTVSYTPGTAQPPCIKQAITQLEKGENLPHSGRFMLATFLLSKGQNTSQIEPLFKNAPDYNQRVTLYQLGHLAEKKYVTPSCDKLKTQGLCCAECNITNPLQFGRKKNH